MTGNIATGTTGYGAGGITAQRAFIRGSTISGNAGPAASDVYANVGLTAALAAIGTAGSAAPACAGPGTGPTANGGGTSVTTDVSCWHQSYSELTEVGDLRLGPLADNGGPTRTMAPLAGSPLMERSVVCAGLTVDQRGVARPRGLTCDAGAVEVAYGGYHPLDPARIYDSRELGEAGKLGPGAQRTVPIAGVGGVPASHVSAVIASVTVTNNDHASHLTVFPTGTPTPTASNLNWTAGETIANLVTVLVDAASGTVTVRNNEGSTHVIVDVAGWYDDGSKVDGVVCPCGDGFQAATPQRALDTRTGGGFPFGPGEQQDLVLAGTLGIPADADAVAINLTGVLPSVGTHITAWPAGHAMPAVSNMNLPPGAVAPNFAVVKLGIGGAISLRNNSGMMHLIVDVMGWYSTTNPYRFRPIAPLRVLDTRNSPGTPTGPGQSVPFYVSPIAGGEPQSFVANLTGAQPSQATHLTVYTRSLPATSNLNLQAGETRANLVMTGPLTEWFGNGFTGGPGWVVNNSGTVHVIVDLVGWFA